MTFFSLTDCGTARHFIQSCESFYRRIWPHIFYELHWFIYWQHPWALYDQSKVVRIFRCRGLHNCFQIRAPQDIQTIHNNVPEVLERSAPGFSFSHEMPVDDCLKFLHLSFPRRTCLLEVSAKVKKKRTLIYNSTHSKVVKHGIAAECCAQPLISHANIGGNELGRARPTS